MNGNNAMNSDSTNDRMSFPRTAFAAAILAGGFVGAAALAQQQEAPERQLRGDLRRPLVVVERDGVVLGYALVALRSGSALARLYSIALVPEASGTGLGARLLDAVEQASADRGATVMRLEVRADNAAAIRLYERRGYRRFGLLSSYYEDGQDALRFEKRLDLVAAPADAATG
jgi:ribosomal protein S18 acetylase RimI-like enzyme